MVYEKTLNSPVLQFSLTDNKLLLCMGYEGQYEHQIRGRLRLFIRHQVGRRELFLNGVFWEEQDKEDILNWLEEYDRRSLDEWISHFDAEFNLVVWDRAKGEVQVVCDRVGIYRLYVHADGGIVTITDTLMEQIRLQKRPRIGGFGLYTLLTLQYPLDPYTVLQNTFSINAGQYGVSRGMDVRCETYFFPVEVEPIKYTSVESCITGLDNVFSKYFANRISQDRVPLVMLSGGIDSLCMLYYLAEAAPGSVETLTFATEGQKNNELEESKIAAHYYNVPHHELLIRCDTLAKDLICSLSELDNGAVYYSSSLRDWLVRDGRSFDVFRGEDTRLHTPMLDLPTLIGLVAHRTGLHKSNLLSGIWNFRYILKSWPFRKGRNYIDYFLSKTDLVQSVQLYTLGAGLRYFLPEDSLPEGPLQQELFSKTASIAKNDKLDNYYRRLVGIAMGVQYSENMAWAKFASSTKKSEMIMPFYDPKIVESCNKIPLSISMRSRIISPIKTHSPFPVIDKYIMRKLLKGKVPDSLLFRRKAAPAADNVLFSTCWRSIYSPILSKWGRDMVENIADDENRSIAKSYLNSLLQAREKSGENPVLAAFGRNITHLAVLHFLCSHPKADLKKEISKLAEEI